MEEVRMSIQEGKQLHLTDSNIFIFITFQNQKGKTTSVPEAVPDCCEHIRPLDGSTGTGK